MIFFRNSKNKITIADVNVEQLCSNEKDSDYKVIFQGLFGNIKLLKNIESPIQVILNNKFRVYNENRVEFENAEFEKKFDVFCKNRQLACEIISPELIEMLMGFYQEYNILFEINIIDDNIYIRFFTGKMFEPKWYSSTYNNIFILYNFEIYYRFLR